MSNKKTIKYTFIALIIVLVLSATLFYFFTDISGSRGLPEAFLQARREAASVSQEIVQLTSESASKVSEVDGLVDEGKTNEAFTVIEEARGINENAHQKAFELSRILQRFTESLSGLDSTDKIQVAYEAIATELGLVNEFIAYTDQMETFLANLHTSVVYPTPENRFQASSSLEKVNEKIRSINQINGEFLQKMEAFDSF